MSGNYLSMLKKRSWRKTLAVAVTAGILAGGYSTAMAANYSQTITGTSADTAYTSIIQPDNVYDFGAGGATIKPAKKALSVDIGAGVDNVTLKATGAELVFHSNSDDYRKGTVTFKKDGAGIVNIDAKKTIIRSYQTDYDGGSRAVVLNGASADNKAVLNVKGDLEVGVYSQGSDMTDTESEEVYGIFAKANSVVNVDGNYSMAPIPSSWGSITDEETGLHFGYGERTDYSRIAAMYAGTDSQINVKGNVNMTIKGSGLVAKGANSAITVGGGTMKMYDEAGWLSKKYLKNFYIAAAADGGKVNINMNEAANASGTNKTEMLGDVLASGAGSTLNIGLNTKDSKLSGVVRSENGGTANMYLGSGTWENKVFGNLTGFGGSVVENLVGGADADHRGVILQKDNNKLTVNNYSGHTMVFYDHTGNGTESIHYAGGDTLIKNAAAGSSIILSTGNNDITMDDEAQVNKVLATLAGKLTYEGFANKNLDAKVQIASGLTASSAAAKVGDITFGSNGKGEFVTAPPKPVETTYNKTLTGVYNDDKATYKDVLAENNGQYNFGEGANVTIDGGNGLALDFDKNKGVKESIALNAANGSLTLKSAAGTKDSTHIVAAKISHTGNFDFNAANTNIIASQSKQAFATTGLFVEGSDRNGKTSVNVKGNLNINAKGSGADSYMNVTGLIVTGDAALNVDGNLVMKDENGSWGIKDGDKSGYAQTVGVKVGYDGTTQKGATLNVKGLTDLVVDGSGVIAEQAGTINFDGDVKIKTNKDSGKVAYSVAATSGGVANINMNAGRDGAGDKTVNIEGNVGAISGWAPNAAVNIGLSNEQSTLHGVVVNTTNTRNPGQVNLYVNNNALWTNESYGAVDRGFKGSNVGKFVGGSDASHAGFVLQKDSRPLTIGNYSGHTVLVYEHTGDGSEASHFAAGDTHIKNAAAGSGIVVSTDNNGIDTGNTELVNKVLNNLAGKLYYDAFATGEKNLNGVVQIASGLTGSSVSKVVGGDITFSEADGKGQYVTAPTIKTDFTTSITGVEGTDKEYVDGGIYKNGEYIFGQDSNINIATSDTDSGITAKGNVVVKAEGSTLNINSKGKFGIDNTVGSSNKNNPYNVTITADKLNIYHENLEARSEGIHILNGYSKNDQTDKVAKVVINGDTNINAYGVDYTLGAYVAGNSLLEINGNVAMKGQGGKQWGVDNDGTSSVGHYSISGLYAGSTYFPNQSGGKIVVNGNVDLAVNGTGVLANGNGSSVVINGGGTILTNKDNQDVHYALAAENGSVSVNMNKDNTAAGTNKVDIKGNIGALNGAAHPNDTVKDTIINIGLSTADSVLTGVAVNNFTKEQLEAGYKPQLNMYVSNGATWNNEAYGKVVDSFVGSKVDKFVGGSDASHAGYIVQKDANALTIGNYSGHTILVYEHTNDGSEAGHFAAGDTHIKNAAVGSGIVVSTDNTGIDTDNTELVNKVLNNLAGKLYYDAFATGEKNLNGVVQIASGLTGSSVSKVVGGDITFSEADGKGQYVTAPPKPVEHVFDKQIFEDIDESGPLDYWKTGNPYVGKGVKRTSRVIGQDDWGFDIYEVQYNFVENSTINVDANRGDVIASGSASSQFAAIDQNNDGTVKVLMNDKKLTLNVNGVLSGYSRKSAGIKSTSGNLIIDKVSGLDINVTNATFGGYGIWVQGDSGYANGDAAVTINNGDTLDKAVKIHNNSSPLDAAIYVKNNSGTAALDIKGVVDIDVKGETDALYMNEGKMNIGGGSIVARGQGKAINAYHGTITVNAQYDQDGNIKAAEKALETDIYGNVKVYGNNKTAIGLNTAGSTFTGAIHTADNGRVDMILSDGALWTNKLTSTMSGFAGSTVNQLVGGATADKAGYILQSDSNRLNVNNYSGHTVIVYEHTGDGSDASHFAAGDTHIKKAAAGSSITMSTDNNGINTGDQELVNKVLNNLAGKLYYDAFVTGEKNLSGVVQIASGLTGSSISKVVSGDITFNDKTGQGQYGTTPVPPTPPEHQTEVNFTDAITGDKATDTVFVEAGVLKENGEYVFEKDSNITLTGANAALNAKQNVVIKAEGSTVNFVTNAGEDAAQAIKNAAGKNINITADKTVVKVESTSGRVDGIYMSKGDITVNGALDVTAVGNSAQGVYANSGNHTFNGDVKITVDGKGGGWGHYGASGLYATSTMGDSKGSTITVNGMVDISGNGNGIYANAGGSSVTVQGGKIVVDDKNNKGYGAIRAENGVVNMNAKLDESGNLVGGNGKLVDITGNIVAGTGAVNPADKNGTKTAINLALDTKESKLHGLIINEFPAEGKPAGDLTFTGETNLVLQNGATWINENLKAEQAAKGSDVTKFVGGSDLAHAGVIVQKDTNNLSIGNYSGHSYLVYEHINDGTNATDFTAGDTHIKNAAAGSGITMVTDNTGIDVNNFDQVSKVLNNLAGKLYYDAYVTGEKNLTGKVQIASGLTGSAISQDLASGDMGFNETTGQGNVVGETIKPQPKPEPPAHQTEVNFSETITGNIETDKVYVDSGILKENGEYVFEKDSNITMSGTDAALNAKNDVVIKAEGSTVNFVTNAGENAGQAIKNAAGKNINITADKTVVKVESTSGRVDGIYMSKGDITVNGALDVTAVGNGAQGVYANSGNHTFNGDVKITVDGKGGGWGHYGASGLYATSTMGDSKGSTITVNGMVDISGNGNGIYANAGGSSVTVQGGKIVVDDKNNKGYGAIRAENGVVNMNAKLDESGKLVGGNGKLVDITGNIVAGAGAVNPADKNGTKTAINLALDTKESKLHGLILNEFPEEGKQEGSLTFTGETNLALQNGATWINESVKAEQAAKTLSADGAGAQGSYVTNFIGGKDMASAGVIVQKDTNALTIGNYSGHTYLVYEHTGDGTNATDFAAGDTHIKNAAASSGVTMVTDNINGKIDVNNKDQVSKVLNNLAGKLYYEAFANGEKNLTGKVQISSGLTGSSISQDLASGNMAFGDKNGQGSVIEETIKPGNGGCNKGDYETLMMYGARAAMVDSMVAWRDTTAESFVRADELHKGAEEGAWVRINRGKVDYSGSGTEINGNFYGVQTGFDKSMGDGWTAGLMFDYRDGDSDYKMGSEGEHKLYGMGIYGTKDLGSNDYIDVVAKFGKVENDFIARNETGKELSGEYSAAAYSMSAQYGKRFEDSNGGYFEPQAQLTWSHVNSDTYDAHCGDQVMNIDQTAFDSFVGRLGVQAGQITDRGQAYVRLSIAHEFAGDIDGVYLAKDGGLKTTQYNAGDTWSELNIGGSYKLSKCANFYADITKTLTGDYKQDWKFNAGMSFSF